MAKQKPYAMISFDISEVRKTLRKNIPQINKLESLADLENLKLIGVNDKGKISIIFYEGIASQELYPDVGGKLIEKKVIREDNLMNSWIINKGQSNEYEEVYMNLDFPGYSVWVFLKACNPNYKISHNSKILKTNFMIN